MSLTEPKTEINNRRATTKQSSSSSSSLIQKERNNQLQQVKNQLRTWSVLLVLLISTLIYLDYTFATTPIERNHQKSLSNLHQSTDSKILRSSLSVGDGVLLDVRELVETKFDGVLHNAIQLPFSKIKKYIFEKQFELLFEKSGILPSLRILWRRSFFSGFLLQKQNAKSTKKKDNEEEVEEAFLKFDFNIFVKGFYSLFDLSYLQDLEEIDSTTSTLSLEELIGKKDSVDILNRLNGARIIYVICSESGWRSQQVEYILENIISKNQQQQQQKVVSLKYNVVQLIPDNFRQIGGVPNHVRMKPERDFSKGRYEFLQPGKH